MDKMEKSSERSLLEEIEILSPAKKDEVLSSPSKRDVPPLTKNPARPLDKQLELAINSQSMVEEEFKEYRERLGSLVQQKNAEILALNKKLAEVSAFRDQSEEKLTAYRDSIEKLIHDRLLQLETSNRSLETETNMHKASVASLEKKYSSLEILFKERSSQFEKEFADHAALKKDFSSFRDTSKKTVDEKNAEISYLKTELDLLSQDLKKASALLEEKTSLLESYNRTIENMRSLLAGLGK